MITLRTRQGNTATDALRSLEKIITPEVKDEILRLAAPGETRSLTKRLRFIELADALDRTDLSLSVLNQLASERPDDTTITTRLAFLLPPEKKDRALQLLARAASSPDIIPAIQIAFQEIRNRRDPEEGLSAFSLIADFLESPSLKEDPDTNLSWIAYHSHPFFESSYTYQLPNLFSEPREESEKTAEAAQQFKALASRLARAMLLHAGTAEEGFRLLISSKAWELTPEETDTLARASLLTGERIVSKDPNSAPYFSISDGHYGTRSGEELNISSVSWLTQRISDGIPADEILPPHFLETLTKRNPPAGQVLTAISTMKSPADVVAAWDTLPSQDIYRDAILLRAKTIPGATRFFLSRIREMEKDEQGDPLRRHSRPRVEPLPCRLRLCFRLQTKKRSEKSARWSPNCSSDRNSIGIPRIRQRPDAFPKPAASFIKSSITQISVHSPSSESPAPFTNWESLLRTPKTCCKPPSQHIVRKHPPKRRK